jgi:hypothetical protein
MRYSPSHDGVYCIVCRLFANTPHSNVEFISKPFSDGKNALGNKRGRFPKHEQSKSHSAAITICENFKDICNGQKKDILSKISTAHEQLIVKNRATMLSILDVIMALGKCCLPLRGSWEKEARKENSVFRYFIHWKAGFDDILSIHLKKCPRNAQYLSPTTQNELILCIGQEVREMITNKANMASHFSIMADETTDVSGSEQLTVCIRYVSDEPVGVDNNIVPVIH